MTFHFITTITSSSSNLLRFSKYYQTMKMNVIVKESSLVQPSEKTPKECLWTSNIDQLFKMHMPTIYIYKPSIPFTTKFFDASVLKESLSKVLVSFYPISGRLRLDKEDGDRVWIDCRGDDGVVFVVAETDAVLDDLGDFAPNEQFKPLIPKLDQTKDISSLPLLLVQVTYFKCGGVSLGLLLDHTVLDGSSAIDFMNTWSDLTRGLDIKIPLFMDRTLLRSRVPPTPKFPHIEHQTPPTLPAPTITTSPAISVLKITLDQINLLKSRIVSHIKFSTYEILAGHIWICACKARGLRDDQETKLSIATDGRARLVDPKLPPGYLGNVIFHLTPMGISGELCSRPLSYAASKIHDTILQGDDEYCRSAIDFLEVHPNIKSLVRGPDNFKCPNLGVTSWGRMPIYEADFGWGKPIFMGPGAILYEGLAYMLPSNTNDGSLSLAMSLQEQHMDLFKEYFYQDIIIS